MQCQHSRRRDPVALRVARLAPWPLVLLLLAGCGSGRPETVPISGKITYAGKPVTQGKIVFYPEHGRPATGEIGPDGSYSLTTFDQGDGAVLGKHRVTIKSTHVTEPAHMPKSFAEEVAQGQRKDAKAAPGGQVQWLVPRKYADKETSPLTAEVKRGGGPINFDIPASQ
jgi:hypothetical protein